jgi:hypothetical protein
MVCSKAAADHFRVPYHDDEIKLVESCTVESFIKYYYGDQMKGLEMGRTCSTLGRVGNAYSILAGKPERKRPLGKPWRRWEDNIRMDLGK